MPTNFIYTGIQVSDLDKSIQFYTKALDMKLLFKTKIKETGGKGGVVKIKGLEANS